MLIIRIILSFRSCDLGKQRIIGGCAVIIISVVLSALRDSWRCAGGRCGLNASCAGLWVAPEGAGGGGRAGGGAPSVRARVKACKDSLQVQPFSRRPHARG